MRVDTLTYARHRGDLGRSLLNKPRGYAAYEARRGAEAAGVALVGDPATGRWARTAAGEAWVFAPAAVGAARAAAVDLAPVPRAEWVRWRALLDRDAARCGRLVRDGRADERAGVPAWKCGAVVHLDSALARGDRHRATEAWGSELGALR